MTNSNTVYRPWIPRILDGGLDEADFGKNQEIEFLENELLEIRKFLELSPQQQKNYFVSLKADPAFTVRSMVRSLATIHQTFLQFGSPEENE